MKKVMIGLLLCSLVITILSGCRVNISIGTNDTLTSETYPDAEKYQIGSFTYSSGSLRFRQQLQARRFAPANQSHCIFHHNRKSGSQSLLQSL